MTEDILTCECSSTEHQIVFKTIDGDPDVYCDIYLTRRSLLKRIKIAFKYVFGYKCKYGAWDEFILTKKHTPKLKQILNYIENEKNI